MRGGLFGVAGALVMTALVSAGGWAVVTVQDVPRFAVAGQPLDLTFAVRVHGMHLTSGLGARVLARSGHETTHAVVKAAGERGHYRARLILPRPGEWTLTIHSGHGANDATDLALTVIPAGGQAPVLPPVQRGQRLFIAKGCAACHRHAAVGSTGSHGPRLDAKVHDAAHVRVMLLNPPRPDRSAPNWEMPNLNLTEDEVTALVALLADARWRSPSGLPVSQR